MKKIHFIVERRKAWLTDTYYSDDMRRAFSYASPGARFSPAHKLFIQTGGEEGWDGRVSFFKNNGLAVGLLRGAKKDLEKLGYRAVIKKWKHKPSVELRKGIAGLEEKYSYQNEAVQAMIASLEYGGGTILAATGAGKTKVTADFSTWIDEKILFVVDQIDLLYQSQKEIQEWLNKYKTKLKVGIVGNGKFEPGDLTVATIQTLQAQKNKAKFKAWTKEIAVIIVDELHVQMGRRNYDIIERINPQAVIGLTATLQMRKKEVRYKVFSHAGPVIFEFPLHEGVERGVLTKAVAIQNFYDSNPKDRQTVKMWKKNSEGNKYREIREASDYEHNVAHNFNLRKRLGHLCDVAMEKGFATIVLVNRVKHLREVAKDLAVYKPKLAYGGIDKDSRRKSYQNFDKKKHNLIIANRVLTKGVNIKRVDLIIDASEEQNKNSVQQKVGRGVRLFEGKTGLIYIALNSNTRTGQKAAQNQRSALRSTKVKCLQPNIENLTERQIAKALISAGKRALKSDNS